MGSGSTLRIAALAVILAGCGDLATHPIKAGSTSGTGASIASTTGSSGPSTGATAGSSGSTSGTIGTTSVGGSTSGSMGSASATGTSGSTGATTGGVQTVASVSRLGTITFGQSPSPYDLALGSRGAIYATDLGDNAVVRFLGGTNGGTAWAGGATFAAHGDGVGTDARFAAPYGIAFDADSGTLYVIDSGTGNDYATLRAISEGDAYVSTVCGNGSNGVVDGPCSQAQFDDPAGVALDGAHHLFVADKGSNRIRKVDLGALTVSTVAGLHGEFNTPTAVAVNAQGALFVADYGSHSIKQVSASGAVSTFATLPSSPAAAQVFGVAVDGAGNVYASDYDNRRILRWSPGGVLTATITDAAITGPLGLKVGPDGALYATDGNAVLKITF